MSNARNLANLLNTDTTIATADVANGGITTAKLADNAVTSAKLDTNIAISGTHTVTGASILNGGIDVGGDFNFDVGGGDITLKDDGTSVANIGMESGSFIVNAPTSDTDIIFKGNDGGSAITALTLDMSDGGRLKTNGKANINGANDFGILTIAANTSAMTTRTNHHITLENTDQTTDAKGIINYKTNADSGASYTPVAFGGRTVNPANLTRTGAFCVYVAGTDNVDVGTDERLRVTHQGRVAINNSDPQATLDVKGTFAISNSASSYWNFDRDGSGRLIISDGTSERLRVDGSGRFLVGTTNGTSSINCNSSLSLHRTSTYTQHWQAFISHISTGTYGTLYLQGTLDTGDLRILPGQTERLRLVENGETYLSGVYAQTTSSGTNVNVNSNGLLRRSTSSKKYKNTITDATNGLTELLKLRPVTYKGNNDGDTVFGGLIAEEVHDAGLTEFVQYDNEDKPDSLAYANMVSLCIKAIQELEARIKVLESA